VPELVPLVVPLLVAPLLAVTPLVVPLLVVVAPELFAGPSSPPPPELEPLLVLDPPSDDSLGIPEESGEHDIVAPEANRPRIAVQPTSVFVNMVRPLLRPTRR
jgi:hypothetical protein